ncbi:hypothetical protein OF83DRAFT_1282014 [Amylostereum chailletii]|nr:hypothetical protein OF83DRAFT_1282014 [Amylostereum chailletii]
MGNYFSFFSQAYSPKPQWGVDNIPDLSGKVTIVTGRKFGLWKRDREERRAGTGCYQPVEGGDRPGGFFLLLDLADLKSVRRSAEELLFKEKKLHILFNNAGVMSCPVDLVTEQGYDMQFGCNVIGHFLFTQLLLPVLQSSGTPSDKARVVTTSSAASYLTNNLNFDAFVDGDVRRRHSTTALYAMSKFGNVVVSRELAQRHGDTVVSTSDNPGNIITPLYRHVSRIQFAVVTFIFNLKPEPFGALTQLYAGTAPETSDANGKFFIPWAREGRPNPATQDVALGEKLWTWLDNECNKY